MLWMLPTNAKDGPSDDLGIRWTTQEGRCHLVALIES
jgi:hypothetical protein